MLLSSKPQKYYAKCKEARTKDYTVFIYMKYLEKINYLETKSTSLCAWSWKLGWEMIANRPEGILGADGNVLKLDYGEGCTTL